MTSKLDRPLSGMRVLVCGKGGSGKSSMLALMARVLDARGYQVLALDGDASNPGGLARLLSGLEQGPKPLIDFFGGRTCVTCPVDDPSPLTRKGDTAALPGNKIALGEIAPDYFSREGNVTLFQVGKICRAYEGCDGPMSKVTRDFVVQGEAVTLIDVEAGIEHFGRGMERNVDAVLVVVDPSFESFSIAERVRDLCGEMDIENVWAVLNKVESDEMEYQMKKALDERMVGVLGLVNHDPEIVQAGLAGTRLGPCEATKEILEIMERFEAVVRQGRATAGGAP
jgi:CO dehydrogenase maturation factor